MIPGWEGRDAEAWAGVLGVPRLELHAEVTSTNARFRDATAPFTTVVAHAQREGRGREGRTWHSPPGGGLWMSVLLPLPPGGPPGVVPLAVGVAAAEAVEAAIGGKVGRGLALGLKWPNDLLVVGNGVVGNGMLHTRARKLAGILCEAVPGGIVAGVGVNLRAGSGEGSVDAVSVEGASGEGSRGEVERVEVARGEAGFPAVALEQLAGRAVLPAELAGLLIAALRRWADPPPDRLEGALREAWEARDLLRGTRVRITPGVPGAGRAGPRGRVRGVGEDGSLQVEDEVTGATVSVRAGRVRWVEP